MHGGKTPKGQQNNLKHGLYTDGLFEDEKALWETVSTDDLKDEIKIVKVQLRRALIGLKGMLAANALAQELGTDLATGQEQIKQAANRQGFEASEVTLEDSTGFGEDGGGSGERVKLVRKQPDWRAHIDRLTGRLAHLMQVQFQLQGQSENPSEAAAKIKAAIAEIEDAIEPPKAEQPTSERPA